MIVAAVLVLAMTATTFTTQRQLMSKNMPADALTGPYAQQQKLLLYVLPVVFAVGGIAFPIARALLLDHLEPVDHGPAVLRDPQQPGARDRRREGEAERDRAKAEKHGKPVEVETAAPVVEEEQRPAPARQQPKKQSQEAAQAEPGSATHPQAEARRRHR